MAKGHKDKVAVITGGAKGIGQAFAKRLAEDGVHVAIADVAPGADTVKLIEAAGRQALACQCDITSPDSIAAMASDVQKKFGRCDILINCAGIYPQRAFDDMTFEDWRRVLSINLDSCFLVSKQFVPGMKQRNWGRIVNMASSTLGSVVTGFVHYMSSKAGIVGFTRAMASERSKKARISSMMSRLGSMVSRLCMTITGAPLATWCQSIASGMTPPESWPVRKVTAWLVSRWVAGMPA